MTDPVVVSREELYKQVWSIPLREAAAHYGISEKGLAKMCNRLNVPYPLRDYWLKKEAGRNVRVTPLPRLRNGTPERAKVRPRQPAPDLGPEIEAKREKIRVDTAQVAVAETLHRPHPVIAKWLADKVTGFTPADDRMHRILDALFKALENQGGIVSGESSHRLLVEMDGEKIEFGIGGISVPVGRPVTAGDKMQNLPSEAWEDSGQLGMWIKKPVPGKDQRVWRESNKRPLETLLPEIVAALCTAAILWADLHRRVRRLNEEWEATELRRRELEALKRTDDGRRRRFFEMVLEWQYGPLAHQFLDVIRSNKFEPENVVGSMTVAEWFDWSKKVVAEIHVTNLNAKNVFDQVQKAGEAANRRPTPRY